MIGIGGMAIVYRATHRNQAEFAIKMLLPELSFREDLRTRFLREGYAANSVKHPGVVQVVDDDIADDGSAFLVMELLHGRGVETVWAQSDQRLPVQSAVAIVDQLLDVLMAAHAKGIIHRDIKPANLFLTNDGVVKVLDFGIARVRDVMASGAQGNTSTGLLLGTPAFMAPEQAKALSHQIDAQTDVWAVGATLFTLVTGRFVHDGENAPQLLINSATSPARSISTVVSHVPPLIASVIDRSLAFEKAMRWPSADAMRTALRDACRNTYGTLPTRESLSSSPPASAHASAPSLSPQQQTMPLKRVSGATTAQPVSHYTPPGVSARSRAPLFIGLCVLAAIAISLSVVAYSKFHRERLAAEPSATPVSSSVPAQTIVATAAASTSTPMPNASVSVVDVSTLPTASTTPVINATRPPPPTSATVKKPLPPVVNCDPPYYFDPANPKD